MGNRKPQRRQGDKRPGQRKKKGREAISGFSTLNQVAGVPKPREHHSSIPVAVPGPVEEPHPLCAYCGKEIENIASSFSVQDGGYAHFDCVLGRIRESEKPSEGETVSYIGSGRFAVVGKNEEGKLSIVKVIPVETPDALRAMKENVGSLRQER